MNIEKRLSIVDANLLYLIGALLFLTVGVYFQTKMLIPGLIITEYIIILLPPILYLKMKKMDIKKTMRLNRISLKHGMLVGVITILTYPIALAGNVFFMFLLSLLGNLNIPQLPTAENVQEYILLMFIVSISAGICEEVFFRGFILPGYEVLGKKKAIIISAILFGVFHFNLYNLMGPIVLGLVFGYLVIVTDSLYAGIIGHIVNNGFAVTLGFIVNLMVNQGETIDITASNHISTTLALLRGAAVFLIIGIGTGLIAYKLIKIIKQDMARLCEVEYEKKAVVEDVEVGFETQQSMNQWIDIQEKRVKWDEFIPLLLIFPIVLFMAYLQIREIIALG